LGLGIEAVPDHPARALTEVLSLARLHGLMAYDAAYLGLLTREGVPLATLGDRLAEAAAAPECRSSGRDRATARVRYVVAFASQTEPNATFAELGKTTPFDSGWHFRKLALVAS
jgi:hypothetical protein